MVYRIDTAQSTDFVPVRRFDEEPDFKKRAYERVVQLQAGDAKTRKGWTLICDVSRAEFMKIYQRLEVTLTERGESFYQSQMGCVVEDLKKKGLLELEEGRYLMFTDEKHEGEMMIVTTLLELVCLRRGLLWRRRAIDCGEDGWRIHVRHK